MNCYLHSETPANAFCRSCGRPLCAACQRLSGGTIFCPEHAPVGVGEDPIAGANPYAQPAAAPFNPAVVDTSPGLAFLLGWIPGVGAIYNGQYIKGLVHAVIFGLIVTLVSNEYGPAQPLLGIVLAAFTFYMPFEAFHTAKKRRLGIAVDEWSSFMGPGRVPSRAPLGPIILIGLGVLFLLDTLHLVEFREIWRFWPVLLIVIGAYMLYSRVTGQGEAPPYPVNNTSTGGPDGSFVETRREQ
jgi:hypothetical protein